MIRFALATQPAPATAIQRYATIMLSTHRSAQGPVVRRYRDGRVVIDTGTQRLSGMPLGHQPVEAPIWSPLFAGLI
jgi:hypothetical protein